jgi:ribonuclease HI
MTYIIHTDGGARGNPGPAAVGVSIERCTCSSVPCTQTNRQIEKEFGKTIGETTNNVAEYTAVIEALKYMKTKAPVDRIQFLLDSNLVVSQLMGVFKIKDARLRMLMMEVRSLEQEVRGEVTYAYVPREQNTRADMLVNQALDEMS